MTFYDNAIVTDDRKTFRSKGEYVMGRLLDHPQGMKGVKVIEVGSIGPDVHHTDKVCDVKVGTMLIFPTGDVLDLHPYAAARMSRVICELGKLDYNELL